MINTKDILIIEIASICLYRGVLEDKAVQSLLRLLKLFHSDDATVEGMIEAYCGVHAVLLAEKAPDFLHHVSELILHDENPFTISCERCELGKSGPLLKQAISDLRILEKLASIDCNALKKEMKAKLLANPIAYRLIDTLPNWNAEGQKESANPWEGEGQKESVNLREGEGQEESANPWDTEGYKKTVTPWGAEGYEEPGTPWNAEEHIKPGRLWGTRIEDRIRWHEKNGAGLLSKHAFFTWNGSKRGLTPVKNPDPITLDKLYLLDWQKDIAIRNTKIFLSGKAANNVLFYGDRGTGKSSIVKALANEFSPSGLRLIEVPKEYLDQIPDITAILSERGMKFILFIDDLAFENNEEKYTALKAVLEGGIEHKPANILLYATSNRRHLVKESFADRKGIYSDNPDEEIRARDSIQEKLSLADRFGITIVFSSPAKKEYLQIVHKMAEEENISIDKNVLELKAMQWEMAYNGMSPRTARQFIYWVKAEMESS